MQVKTFLRLGVRDFKMSVDYASLLSDYDDKGVCGLPEVRGG